MQILYSDSFLEKKSNLTLTIIDRTKQNNILCSTFLFQSRLGYTVNQNGNAFESRLSRLEKAISADRGAIKDLQKV